MKPLGKALKAAYYNRDSAQKAVDELLMAYRSTPHPATKAAPGDILFRHGYRADFPRAAENLDEVQAAGIQDKKQKQERKQRVNASTKRVPMRVQLGDRVLLKAYPKGKKFQPVFAEEVYEVVQIEDKGVALEATRKGGTRMTSKSTMRQKCQVGKKKIAERLRQEIWRSQL